MIASQTEEWARNVPFSCPITYVSRNMPMIEATIKMTVPLEKRKEVLQTLTELLGVIRHERGCISCDCAVDVKAEDVILFREEWQSSEDLDTHRESGHFRVLIGLMTLLRKEPEIRFSTIASTTEAEMITAVRA
jgi:quinol monooxygenase YgiN